MLVFPRLWQAGALARSAQLQSQVESLVTTNNFLRENHAVLVAESQRYLSRALAAEKATQESKTIVAPLQERVRVLEAEKAVWDEEQARHEAEVKSLSTRLASVLERHNAADPEEYRKALERVSFLEAEAAAARQATEDRVNALTAQVATTQAQLEALQAQLEVKEKEVVNESDKVTRFRQRVIELNDEKKAWVAEKKSLLAANSGASEVHVVACVCMRTLSLLCFCHLLSPRAAVSAMTDCYFRQLRATECLCVFALLCFLVCQTAVQGALEELRKSHAATLATITAELDTVKKERESLKTQATGLRSAFQQEKKRADALVAEKAALADAVTAAEAQQAKAVAEVRDGEFFFYRGHLHITTGWSRQHGLFCSDVSRPIGCEYTTTSHRVRAFTPLSAPPFPVVYVIFRKLLWTVSTPSTSRRRWTNCGSLHPTSRPWRPSYGPWRRQRQRRLQQQRCRPRRWRQRPLRWQPPRRRPAYPPPPPLLHLLAVTLSHTRPLPVRRL